jgi:hypothetical protein
LAFWEQMRVLQGHLVLQAQALPRPFLFQLLTRQEPQQQQLT